MRISTQQMYNNSLSGIQNYQQTINNIQEEISNNKKMIYLHMKKIR